MKDYAQLSKLEGNVTDQVLLDLYSRQVENLLAIGEKLSDWESDFVNSMEEQLDSKRLLTNRQVYKLSQIWHKYF